MRPIDADELWELLDNGYDVDLSEVPETKVALLEMIDYQETIDAVPVVRCKDCTYCSHFTDGHLECRLLYNLKPVPTTYCQMEENDFCSYGVRKGEQTM